MRTDTEEPPYWASKGNTSSKVQILRYRIYADKAKTYHPGRRISTRLGVHLVTIDKSSYILVETDIEPSSKETDNNTTLLNESIATTEVEYYSKSNKNNFIYITQQEQ